MSDPKSGIPAWQRVKPDPPTTQGAEESTKEITASGTATSETQDTPLVQDQVRKFLQDPSIQNASDARKRAFLESKGISKATIDEHIPSSVESSAHDAPQEAQISPADKAVFNTVVTSERVAPPAAEQKPGPPPIITYPEFLMQSRKPPPLVTVSRLVNAFYAIGGVGLAAYGVAKYIVNPMTVTLAEARSEFAQHTAEKLEAFNGRLEGLVSTIPSKVKHIDFQDTADTDSLASDPTELFSRDIGVQTTPSLSPSRRPSSAASTPLPTDPVTAQTTRLSIIHSHLAELVTDRNQNSESSQDLFSTMKDLEHYLDTLIYARYTSNDFSTSGDALAKSNSGRDAADALKDEIRGVKGVLLSARTFPGGRAARVGA
ncbi:hypothetical protein LTR28_009303 [Elasticomyces elasticus]|nr:hypothetical protein LTR28_009303 [Elasticomyces elasticus]